MPAPVNVTDVKATSSEQRPASEMWFRFHPGHQTKIDSRDPTTRTTGYVDRSNDPVGYRTWLATYEQAVMEAP